MSAIRGKHTSPELAVRKALRRLKCSYKLHSRKLPGTPDLVLQKYRATVFVHGCFWHQHKNCRRLAQPKTNRKYWIGKLQRNVERFAEVRKDLRRQGWKVVVVWECQTKDGEKLISRLKAKLGVPAKIKQ